MEFNNLPIGIDGSYDDIVAAELVESEEAGELFCCANRPDDGTQVDYSLRKLTDILKRCNAYDALLAACEHGAMSIHHPACTHGKSGAGNTCECHVQKCFDAIADVV